VTGAVRDPTGLAAHAPRSVAGRQTQLPQPFAAATELSSARQDDM